ncbi:MAG: Sec-independent protein translocase subunit TatA [Canibacter sp.]
MFANLTGWHFLIILFIILLLFGAPKLPGLAKSLGQSMKILKKEVRDVTDDDKSSNTNSAADSLNEAQHNSTATNDAPTDSPVNSPRRDDVS